MTLYKFVTFTATLIDDNHSYLLKQQRACLALNQIWNSHVSAKDHNSVPHKVGNNAEAVARKFSPNL